MAVKDNKKCGCENNNSKNIENQDKKFNKILKKRYFTLVFLGQTKKFKLPPYIKTYSQFIKYRQIINKEQIYYTSNNMLIVNGTPISVIDFQNKRKEEFNEYLIKNNKTGSFNIVDYTNKPFLPK